jgi:glycosyltransferase involved in cell wall biosynthesis
LQSVFTQSHTNLEVIAVDDGSNDSSLEILKSISDPRFKLLQQTNKGACAARNLGYSHSIGSYIQYLDADDVLSQQKIESQLVSLEQHPDSIANGRWGRFYQSTDEPIKWGPHPSLQQDLDPISWLLQNHMSQTGCWLTPRALVEKAGPWREDLVVNQDGEFFSRVILASKKVLYVPEAKVFYRSNIPTSISAAIQKPAAIESRYKTIELLEQHLLKTENSPRVKKALADAYQRFIYSYYPKSPALIIQAENKVKALGGSSIPVPGGNLYKYLSKIVGWKKISLLKHRFGRL